MKRMFLGLAGIDLLLAGSSWMLGGTQWLLNTQIGFFSSALVLAASMFSYSQMVYRRIESGTAVPEDERDTLDKLEDPYDLYSESEEAIEGEHTLKETIRQEKQRLKKNRRSLIQVLRDSRASLSFLRLGAYLLLFVGFFYLSSNRVLHIPSYIVSLALPVIVIVGMLMTQKEQV